MSKEKGKELFRALHSLLDAITGLNLKDLEAEAQAESSKQGVYASSKGKAKDPNLDWEDVPFHPVPITPLSCRPKFSQVVGSSSETPIVSPSPVPIAAVSLAERPVISVVEAAWTRMNAPQCQGQNAQQQQQQQQQQNGGGQDGDGQNGGGLDGGGQDGGGQAPLAYHNAAQFIAAWDASPSDQARDNLKQEAITRSPAQDVQFAAMVKNNLRLQATVGQFGQPSECGAGPSGRAQCDSPTSSG
jgi:hypothetical protein